MAISSSAPAIAARAAVVLDRWTVHSALVLLICILAWAFDIYEQTVMQLVTPLLIKEWHITPATIGWVTAASRWIGSIGIFIFPALADLYGRKPMLSAAILGYSLLTGLTGFVQTPMQLFAATAATRVALAGENPVGLVMVTETAPAKWRATALGGLVGGYPFGYMLTTLAGLVVVPLWGWRALYWLGILPAFLVFGVALCIRESPRFEHVTVAMVKDGFRKQFDIFAPVRHYPREMLLATAINSFYLFTWIGWSAWMPQFLATEKHLGFQTTASWLSIWMFAAIFAYWICGALCDRFGRRYVIPAFVIPAAILLSVLGWQDDRTSLFILGGITNFLITGSFGTGLGYISELFPTQIRGTATGAVFFFRGIVSGFAPAIIGVIATHYSIAAGLPLLGLSFLLLAPLFYYARETTRRDLTDFVGQQAGGGKPL